jgi:hypothetical protein
MNPQHVTYFVIEDLIKGMDGEIIIHWNNRTEARAL